LKIMEYYERKEKQVELLKKMYVLSHIFTIWDFNVQ
jgi:hypothetical protein